jgi:hypothetical protein
METRVRATLAELRADIVRHGAKWTLDRRVLKEDGRIDRALGSGEPAAVDLIQQLLKVSDAGTTESLLDDLGRGMARHPRNVLPLVGRGPLLKPEVVCLPFLGDGLSSAQALTVIKRSRDAVRAVRDPALQPARVACLQTMDAATQRLKADGKT